MQWSDELNAGFSTANATWLPVNETSVNVAAQEAAEVSHLQVFRELAKLRQEITFVRGDLAFPLVTEEVIAILRSYQGAPSYLVVINTSASQVIVDLLQETDLPETATAVLRSVTDTSEDTAPGNEVQLDNLMLVGGEGIVFRLPEE
ncbi:maltase 1-like [Penaeus japonicus]|uniref:maltase 1-like n=1 Tax=Penaeus japonicus TaxID=27405 RepID=UPI001C71291A|nr:maltase 1-like [Penaeus japonicus]